MSGPVLKLAIGVPAYGGTIAAEHARMWLAAGHTLAASEERFSLIVFQFIDVCGVDRARSEMLQTAIDEGCDWLLMVDADVWVAESRALLQMISDADRERPDAAIVCAPVQKRRVGEGTSEIMAYLDMHAKTPILPEVLLRESDPLIEIVSCATACMAIKVPAVADLDRPLFRFTTKMSEDLDFCLRVRTAGHAILCDTRVKTFHRARPAVLASHT